VVLEVSLIAAGVFLGLAGEQWRENAEHRENARLVLDRLRTEISSNREHVVRVSGYHASTRTAVKAYLAKDAEERKSTPLKIEGVQVVFFEHTAWDLALATASLTHIDSDLAFGLSRIYNAQQSIAVLSQGLSHAMYTRPPDEDRDGFLAALAVYYDDVVLMEPALLKMYDQMLPMLDRALDGTR